MDRPSDTAFLADEISSCAGEGVLGFVLSCAGDFGDRVGMDKPLVANILASGISSCAGESVLGCAELCTGLAGDRLDADTERVLVAGLGLLGSRGFAAAGIDGESHVLAGHSTAFAMEGRCSINGDNQALGLSELLAVEPALPTPIGSMGLLLLALVLFFLLLLEGTLLGNGCERLWPLVVGMFVECL